MIKNKNDLKLYLEADRIALGRVKLGWFAFFFDSTWRFERLLRYVEYYQNCKRGLFWKAIKWFYWIRLLRCHAGVEISVNNFGPGLSIAHGGPITVNSLSRIGRNCRIHQGVVIGQGKAYEEVPMLGNNIHIGPGVKIIGPVVIGDNTVIAANAVVTKSFPEGNCTIGGIPAKKISDTTSLTPYPKTGEGLVVCAYEKAKALLEGERDGNGDIK